MSNENIQISKQTPLLNGISPQNNGGTKKAFLNGRIYREQNGFGNYKTFTERVQQSPYLVSFEDKLGPGSKRGKKKDIVSYNSNRDKLFIPKPERPRQPINIDKNLIEEEVKVVTADLGIQSDKINYVNPEKPFQPQKFGKDQGTQIMDGDLFNFDIDVQPLLTVIVGKTLEQSMNEIEQEDEISTLREAKAMYLRKNNEEKKRIRNLEEREIQKKFNNDAKKEKRRQKREVRKNTQQVLISRVMSKAYLKKLTGNAIKDLIYRGHFRNYINTTVRNETNSTIKVGSEKLNGMFKTMKNYLSSVLDNQFKKKVTSHVDAVNKHRELLQQQKEERERKKKEEEERKIQEEIARKERRRKRKIERIKKEIKASIIDTGVAKTDAYSEEFTEIDDFRKTDQPYIGVYGDFMGIILATISIIKRDFYSQAELYTIDNFEEILMMIFNEIQGTLNLHFNEKCGEIIQNIIKESTAEEGDDEEKEEFNLNELKTQSDFDQSVWEKIGDILCEIEYNNDYILRHFIEEFSEEKQDEEGNPVEGCVNKEIYQMIIRTLMVMCAKSNYLDHFNLIFDKEQQGEEEKEEEDEEEKKKPKEDLNAMTFEERIGKYEALCMLTMAKPGTEIINEVEFNRSSSKKKAVNAPDFETDFIAVKAYQNNPETHNVLLYDRLLEFLIRNKVFECVLAHFSYVQQVDAESQPMFVSFNETYDNMIDNSQIMKIIQVYDYPPEVEKEENEEEEQ